MIDITTMISQGEYNRKSFTILIEKFDEIEDPRIDRCKIHPLKNILAMYLCAVLCNRTGWDEVYDFSCIRISFFEKFLDVTTGIPSADTFSRVIQRIHPKVIQEITLDWLQSIRGSHSAKKNILLDGKMLRGSYSKKAKPTYLVNAFSSEESIVVAQKAIPEKRNEVYAIKEIIESIDLQGSVISIDAIGCRQDLAQQIIDKSGDYLFAVKRNQPKLYAQIQELFSTLPEESSKQEYHKESDMGHGRSEIRETYLLQAPSKIKKNWPVLQCIALSKTQRTLNGKKSTKLRYFITSKRYSACEFADRIRMHWKIENQLHWVLDVTFAEDKCRIRTGFAAQNISWFRCLALNLLKMIPIKLSIRRKMLKAGDDITFLEKIILNSAL